MTTQPQPDRITAAEIRELFAELRAEMNEQNKVFISMREEMNQQSIEINGLIAELHAMRAGLQQAATQPAQIVNYTEMLLDTIVMTYDDNGKPAYKGLGAPFQKFGVRIWDEILPQFTDPATLKPGKNPITPTPARVLMNTPKEGKTAQPHKITGKV